MDSVPESPNAPVATRTAATVVLLRDGELGLEVLLAERPSDRGSFAGAWVFPGGAVDESDAVGAPPEGLEAARRAAVREVEEEVGLVIDAQELVPFSLWTPPRGAPKQLTTAFFAVRVPDGELRLAPDEVVAAEWLRPIDALDRHAAGGLTLWPPTWVTLHGLLDAPSVDAALAGFAAGEVRPFRARRDEARRMVLWQEDEEYDAILAGDRRGPAAVPDDAPDARGNRHRLMMDRLPWVYLHTF
ncbi:NUDIX hydrolase [Agromyces italicus]|uniref:NUDIX hydrolase n=1 Tax=Agromyces italicus TaxID=279572 RepID=UPI0003B7B6E7|nr:NUDIX domain-containing protein [Agromyces italicus]